MATTRRKTVKKKSTYTEALHAGGAMSAAVSRFLFPASNGEFRSGELFGSHLDNMKEALLQYERTFLKWSRKGRVVETYWVIRITGEGAIEPFDESEPYYNKVRALRDLKVMKKKWWKLRHVFKLFCIRRYAKLCTGKVTK
jgi:hypothetical protein